jgi:Secretion system C-terminal sorting domain
MKKIFWLTSLSIACCCHVAWSQQHDIPDSAVGRASAVRGAAVAVLANFSGTVKEMNKVTLQWDVDSAEDGDYLVMERSTDGIHYETIGALRKAGDQDHYELTDMAPPNGIDLYRIKYMGKAGQLSYSKTVELSLSGEVDFKFYPNPVDKLFIIRTEHIIDIQIVDANGATRLSKRLQPGIQVVNISSMEKGLYILRVADKESNRVVSNQLIKN